jgi:hypothetical protein
VTFDPKMAFAVAAKSDMFEMIANVVLNMF